MSEPHSLASSASTHYGWNFHGFARSRPYRPDMAAVQKVPMLGKRREETIIIGLLSRRNRFMMLRFIAFFLLFTVSLGRLPASAADPVFPLGSHTGFVPPPGFVVSKRFPGFENPDTRSSIVVATLPPQSYADLEASIASDALKKQGITEDKRENLKIANGTALLVMGSEEDSGQKFRKSMLLARLPEGVVLVAVLVPESALKTYSDDVIRASLSTLAVRATVPLDELVALMPIKLNDLSGLRPVRMLGTTGVVLSSGTSDTPTPADQPMFAVMIGQGGPEQTAERSSFARNLFTGLGDVKDVQIISGDMLRLGGGSLATHELQAEAKEAFTNTPMKLVQWVRFGPGIFIRMIGIARADQWSTAFTHFRAVRDGIAPRE
jgi:hypothetical protein